MGSADVWGFRHKVDKSGGYHIPCSPRPGHCPRAPSLSGGQARPEASAEAELGPGAVARLLWSQPSQRGWGRQVTRGSLTAHVTSEEEDRDQGGMLAFLVHQPH